MKKLKVHLLGRFLIAIALACSMAVSTLGGLLVVDASSYLSETDNQNVSSLAQSRTNQIYDDKDKAWTFQGNWSVSNVRRAYRRQLHISNSVGDYATILITGSSFTLIFTKARDYSEVDVYVDDIKIHTINQRKSKTSHQSEWKSPDIGPGSHAVKFVHASGKVINIDAIRVRGSEPNPDPTPTGVLTTVGTPTLIPSGLPSPTESPFPIDTPVLTASPGPTDSVPVESPTSTLLSEVTLSPTPSLAPSPTASPTQAPTQSPAIAPTLTATTPPTSSPTYTQTPTKPATPTVTAVYTPTVLSTLTSAPSAGTVYYVSPRGNDANPGSQAQPLRTIKKAVSMASAGAIIRVLAGTYPEAISLEKSNIKITAEPNVHMNGFFISGNNNLVSGFTITNPSSDYGIRVSGNNNIIEKNDISNTGQDGIWFFGHDNTFRGNYIHDILAPSIGGDPHVDCFQTWGWNWETYNILFEKNTCNHTRTSGSNQILMLENQSAFPMRDIIFRNNVFIMHDSGYTPMRFNRKSGQLAISNMQVINNTFYNTTNTGQDAVSMVNISNGKIINNVSIGYDQLAGITGGGVVNSNNVQSGNYGMVDYPNFNFHLTSNSPLINAGIDPGFRDDFDGNARPQGAGFDIGAFEYPISP